MITKEEASALKNAKTPGERIQILRKDILQLSMDRFCDLSGQLFKRRTLTAWENGESEIKESAIKNVVQAFKNFNIFISEDWLKTGVGKEPKKFGPAVYDKDFNFDEEYAISQEILCFRNGTKGIVSNVEDEAMEPTFKVGDIVAGELKKGNEIKKLLGLDCIVKLKDGTELVRRLDLDSKGQYVLIAKRKSTNPAVITNPDINAAAEVIWIRRRSSI